MKTHRKYPGYVRPAVQACCVLAAILMTAAVLLAQASENFESPVPVLLSDGSSPYVLVANAEDWRGSLPGRSAATVRPGDRVVVFVRNIELLGDESVNAFRIFGRDKDGRRYRFVAESLTKVERQPPGTYALLLRLVDPVAYNGQPQPDSALQLTVSWRGNLSNSAWLVLGDRTSDPKEPKAAPAPSFEASRVNNVEPELGDRTRFMEQAAFGPSRTLDTRIKRIGLRSWINEQFALPYPTIPYPNFPQKPFDGFGSCGTYGTSPDIDLCHRNHYWNYNNAKWFALETLYGEDQLRRKVSWALHQIWVVSSQNINQQRGTQEYIEILDRNAFGNYRTLMYEMTLSPAMGEFLDMVRSTRQNPNENYPRELLQLFTTGLYMLNPDGTYQLDGQGNRIPTYDQSKIDQFTKVFTGWSHCNNGLLPECSGAVPGVTNFVDPMYMPVPGNHDLTAKALFSYPGAPNQNIAACTNCTTPESTRAYATDSLNKTLDNIFNHPNVGPFVSKLLIQHLVTSDPSPAYVGRVAAAFNNNGVGVRGDMKAVIRAILLDREARGSAKTDPTYGRLRSPVDYMSNIMRLWNAKAGTDTSNGPTTPPASCNGRSDGIYDWALIEQGQNPWTPPSVFSYYSPEYVVPGTDVLGPEFAITNTSSSFRRNTHTWWLMYGYWFESATAANPYPYTPCGTSLDLSEAISWVTDDPTGNMLIEGVNRKMMHGTMSDAMKAKLRASINVNVAAREKAIQVIFLTATSSQYQVQR